MRVDAVELRHVRMRLQQPFETSFGSEAERDCLLLRVEAEGLTGWGECPADRSPGYSYETAGTAWEVLTHWFIPAVLGQPLETVEDLSRCLSAYKGHPMARAGLEMAFWDLRAQAKGKSLAALLGGVYREVMVGVSIGIQRDSGRLLRLVEGYLNQGYRRVKLKIKPGRDLTETRAVRDAFPDLALQVDANSAYTLDETAVFEAMDNWGLLLVEQPLAEDDLVDHARLQRRLQTAVCLDESILSTRHARQALDLGSCRVINIKAGRVGGLGEAVAIHDLCLQRQVPVWCGGMLETGIGRAANLALASLPGFTLPGDISATDRYYVRDIAGPAFVLNADSTIDVPTGTGLGVEIIPKELGRVTLRRELLQR
jgi:O-succinylbenzoate synthase